LGCGALVVYSDGTARTIQTSWHNEIAICHIRMMESDCYRIVTNPDTNLLNFVENSPIEVLDPVTEVMNDTQNIMFQQQKNYTTLDTQEKKDENMETEVAIPKVDLEAQEGKIESDVQETDNEEVDEPRIVIKVGTTKKGKEIVFEPNNTKMVSHPNMGIIGTMGTGKTQFARSVIAQFTKESIHNVGGKPVGMLVFDYKGDYKDKEFLDAVGGKCYKFNYPFNPLKLVVNDEVEGMNLPAITADRISDSFAKAYGLGLKQQSNIKQVIIETYADAGITKDPATWNNPVPTMEQVIEKYFSTYDANDKAYALFDKLRDYTIFTTDNSNCVSLFEWLDSVRVIDLTLYPDDTKKVIVSLILDLFYAEMRQLGGSQQKDGFRELRAIIMVDEAHQFLKKDFNSFRSIISEGRMFGVGMILSTQNVSDFKSQKEDYSQFILSWVIHHVNDITKSEIASIFGSSDSNADRYRDFISRAMLFESICKIGSRVEGIRDLPFFELMKQDERFKPKDINLFE